MNDFRKERRRSIFWRAGLFERVSRDVSKCLLCSETIATKNGCTVRLKNHLTKEHEEYEYQHFIKFVKDEPKLWMNISGYFEMRSLADDVIQLAEELGLEFHEERSRFVLILSPPADCDRENIPCTSASLQQDDIVKWLVLKDKLTVVRCREYSRKTVYNSNMGNGEGQQPEKDAGLVKGSKEYWRKWGRVQFLRAIRSKCMEFFFAK